LASEGPSLVCWNAIFVKKNHFLASQTKIVSLLELLLERFFLILLAKNQEEF
jgi:hypothetical protein